VDSAIVQNALTTPTKTVQGKELEMRAWATAKVRGICATVVMLAIVGAAGMAAGQASEEGVANFYSDKFQGKKMASGEVYDKDKLTASHKKLPYGTKVKVTNLENQKSVVVTINDRMAASNPAVIDVTRRAAEELGFVKSGKTKVKLEVEK
jgi:rare lipoprotein A